jgi:hypothetical protein
MATKRTKERDPFNEDNRDFKARLTISETKETIATMKFIGCRNRSVFVAMAIKEFNKIHGQ